MYAKFRFPGCWLLLGLLLAACNRPESELSLRQRSGVISDERDARAILERASVSRVSLPGARPVQLLVLRGTPYAMGFQHGTLLRGDVRDLYARLLGRVQRQVPLEALDEVFDLLSPHIPAEEREEMRGLAHGAGVPLRDVHRIHAIPELSEFGQKKRYAGQLAATSCSNIAAFGRASADGQLYQLRILDWIRDLGIQRWPVVLVHRPAVGLASASFGYAGFVGAVSGMNAAQLVFGEKSYGNPPGESLDGIPFVFLFRKLMREAATLEQAEAIVRQARRTNAYLYLISAARGGPGQRARLLVTDRQRVAGFAAGSAVFDDRGEGLDSPAIEDVAYGAAKKDLAPQLIRAAHGRISAETLQQIAGSIALSSNLQNVIFRPASYEVWLSNAAEVAGEAGKAVNQPWFHFDLTAELTAPAPGSRPGTGTGPHD